LTLISDPIYAAKHLEFRRDTIEPLPVTAVFEVDTPAGRFRMTKAEFHANFPEIVSSVSYRERGLYHYPMIPYKAFRFLVQKERSSVHHELARVDEQQEQGAPDGPEDGVDQVPGE
jgi:hypothetical protein